MNQTIALVGVLSTWLVVLVVTSITANSLFKITYSKKNQEFYTKSIVEGIQLPSEDITPNVAKGFLMLELTVGFILVAIAIFSTVLFTEMPSEFALAGVLPLIFIPFLSGAALGNLRKIIKD